MVQRVKQAAKLILSICPGSSRYRAVTRSGLFDKAYYLWANPDVAARRIPPLLHYLMAEGVQHGRRPNPFFDPCFYQRRYPETKEPGVFPLFFPLYHYIVQGWKEKRQPSHLFDPEYYLCQLGKSAETIGNPLLHFLEKGMADGVRPTPYFDPEYYLRTNPGIEPTQPPHLGAYIHYLHTGALERRRPSLFFDTAWYQDKTPTLQAVEMDLIQHYVEYGMQEGKSPNPVFDPQYYRANNHELREKDSDPFLHYVRFGIPEDRRPCSWFDSRFYRQRYAHDLTAETSPIEHYLQEGVFQGRFPDSRVESLQSKPLISVVVPVYNVAEHFLNTCLRSLLYQSYPRWECCIADDSSSDPNISPLLERWAAADRRIKVKMLPVNRGIVAASNAAAAMATGEYLCFLDNDDELTSECLYEVAGKISRSGADLLYTDEDLTGDDGRRFSIFRKPDFNRTLLLSHNYITHLMVTTRLLFNEVGGFSPGTDGAQDYDLFLKLSERAEKIIHIPKILYHWRASATSTSVNHGQKEYADQAGRTALAGHLHRTGMVGDIQGTDFKFFYRVKKIVRGNPSVSVIICYDRDDDPGPWITNLMDKTSFPVKELVVSLDKGRGNRQSQPELRQSATSVSWQSASQGQGLGSIYNAAAARCTGEYLVFLHSDIVITEADWIETLLEYATGGECGMVGPRIDFQEEGASAVQTLPDPTKDSILYYSRFVIEASSHMNGLQCPQNVLAVSWILCMIKRDLFTAVTGFDSRLFPHAFGDLDLCLRLHDKGFSNVYAPYCRVIRQGLAQRFAERVEQGGWREEKETFQRTWGHVLRKGDPYYNLELLADNGMDIEEFLIWFSGAVAV